jgi:UrcA family protein
LLRTITAGLRGAPLVFQLKLGRPATGAPIQETTVQLAVTYDPVTLTTNSGIALLNDSVADAAGKACFTANPLPDDGTCVSNAIGSAQPQIARAIALARSSPNG